jgi:hypothetical protein
MSLFEHAEFGRAAVVIGPAISVVAFSIIFGRHSAGLGGTLVGVRVVVTAADGIVVRGTGSCAGGHVGADSRSALISAVGNIEQAELVIVAIASGMTVDNVTFAIMLQAHSRRFRHAFVRVRPGVAAAYLLDVHGTCHVAGDGLAFALLAFVAAVGKIELAEFVGIAFVVGVAAQVTIFAAGWVVGWVAIPLAVGIVAGWRIAIVGAASFSFCAALGQAVVRLPELRRER